ncbi:MAG: hypothetical protein K9L88_08705 [Chromatiaceae bacterium]|nr:hypothetical protein [Chromatiaceae bacterium]MCF8015372.1 hypothetical protein [Chromatiaceae bacterium]
MNVQIRDDQALRAITPAALAAYACGEGWARLEAYGQHADVYSHPDRPELIIPRTDALADYASVVAQLIAILAETSGRDALALYRDLLGADRDVIRIRAAGDANDGSVPLVAAEGLVTHTREMLLAAACAASSPRALYRAGANREANEYLQRVRLGQTEQGSFVVKLLAPVPPLLQPSFDLDWAPFDDEPYERKVTRRLMEALTACNKAAERATTEGMAAFQRAVQIGVSANLCEAVSKLIQHANQLEIGVTWARTRPGAQVQQRVRFQPSMAVVLGEAARNFRAQHSRADVELFGTIYRLKRDQNEAEGQIGLRTLVDGKIQSVQTTLDDVSYSLAVQAHEQQLPALIRGDLERTGQRWQLTNAELVSIGTADDDDVNDNRTDAVKLAD